MNLKIAYVALHLEEKYIQSGVGRKILTHLKTWKKLGHEAHFFLHTPDVDQFEMSSIFRYSKKGGVISREVSRSRALINLIKAVEATSPDAIFLRYGLYAWPLERLFSVAPVFMEINSFDVEEYKHRGTWMYWYNRLSRSILFGRSRGLLPVSYEINSLPENKRYRKPSCVIANGIDFDALLPLEAPNNQFPRMALVGSPGMSWHGADKLFPFLRAYPELTLDLVGFTRDDFAGLPVPENVVFHGKVGLDQVKSILSRCDVAIGTMAVHRKRMEESSPLKVRESLCLGIPTIVGYKDTDLDDKNFDFILKLPNTEDNILDNMECIRNFAYEMRGRRVDRDAIRPLLNQEQKEEKRLAFISSHLGSKTRTI